MTDAIARTGPTETVPPAAAAAVLSPAASSYMMATHPSSLPDVGHPPLPPVAPSSQQVVMPSPVRMAANSPIVVPLALRSPHASSPHISPQLAHLHGGAQPNLSMMPAAAADVISQSMSSQTLQSSNKRSRPPALNMTLIPPGERDSSGKGSKGSARSTKRARNKRHSSSNSLSVPRLSPTNSSPHLTPTMGSSPQTYGYPYMMQSHNGMHYMMPLSPLGISSPGGGATPAAMLPPAYAQQGARLMAPAQQAGAYMPYQYAYQMYPGPGHGPLSVGQVLENSNYPGPSDPTVAMSASLRELKQQADEREKQFAQHAGKHVSHGSDGSSNSTDQSGDNNASISQAVSAAASAISSDTRAQSAAVAAAAARNRSRPDVALNGPVPHMSYQYQYPHMYASMSAYPTGIAHYAGMSPTDDDTDRRMITYDGLDKGTKRPGVALGPMGSAKRGKVMRGGDIDPVAGVLPPQGRRRVVTNRKPKAKKKPTKKKPPKKATSTPKKATATPKKATTPKKKASKKATAAMTKISIVPAAAGEEPKADLKPKADSPAIDMQAPLSQRRATVPAQKPVPKKKPVAAAKAKKASTPKLKQSGGRKKPTGVRETVCVGLAPDHPAVLAAGIKPNPAVLDSGGGANRIFKLHEDFFGREVEVFVALDDPTRTVLFKAVDLAAELNRPKNMLSMYLSRKKKKPNSGIVQAGKILYKQSPRLDLKRGCYFMTREALQRFKEHCAKKA